MKISPQISLKVSVIAGFAVILLLMAMLAVVGLGRIAETNRQVEQIVSHSNVKTGLVHAMKNALRERMSVSQLVSVLQDIFKQNDEYLNFSNHGAAFAAARSALEGMPLSPEEKAIQERVRGLTLKTQPLITEAIELALNGNTVAAHNLVDTQIIGAQQAISLELDKLLDLQRRETETAVSDARKAFEKTRLHMLVLGSFALGLGLMIVPLVIRKANRQAQVSQQQAMFDGLTNLPNRLLFADRLKQAVSSARHEQRSFGLLVLDIDRFKAINDNFGRPTGDQVLQFVAACIQACLEESDTLARIDGKEFAILRMAMGDPQDAIELVKKIRQAIAEPFEISNRRLKLTASIGVAMFPSHGADPQTLLEAAHAGMRLAKGTKRGYRVYSEDMDQAEDRVALLAELQHAVENNELILHYQPKIDFNIAQVSGVEVLVRWLHPTEGLIGPERFIPLAEHSGLIKPLTIWVLNSALRQYNEWQQTGIYLPMSVKIPAANIQDPEFPDQIAKILSDHDVPAKNFEIEIKESAVIANPAPAMESIRKLHDLGFQIAIGDFGSGKSSMAHLTELLVVNIKLDKSLVIDMATSRNGTMVVRTTVKLGHTLGLKVVARGVENQGSWDTLKGFGCDSAQGFYLSRPLPPVELMAWLRTSPWGMTATSA